MQKRQLKRLIETGHYSPEPGEIALAMLRRRGIRELLVGDVRVGAGGMPLSAADRIQSQSAFPRQAA